MLNAKRKSCSYKCGEFNRDEGDEGDGKRSVIPEVISKA
jgi:hypothetical protein